MSNSANERIGFQEIVLEKVLVINLSDLSEDEIDRFEDNLRTTDFSNFPFQNSVYLGKDCWCVYFGNKTLLSMDVLDRYYLKNTNKILKLNFNSKMLDLMHLATLINFTFAESIQQVVDNYLLSQKEQQS